MRCRKCGGGVDELYASDAILYEGAEFGIHTDYFRCYHCGAYKHVEKMKITADTFKKHRMEAKDGR